MTIPDYFLINRKLQESDLWLNEPFTRGQAWVDLLGLAHYKPGHIRKDGKRIDLNRGQCGWSQLKLSKRWGWSRGKVKRFLNELEMDQRIEQVNTTICSIITVVNYDAYQPNGHQTDTEQGNRRTADDTTDEQLTDTKNEGVKGSKVLKGLKKKEPKTLCDNPADDHGFDPLPFFEIFWKTYPRRNGKKIGKGDALKKYKTLAKDEAKANEILKACNHYALNCGDLPKDAHRWLSADRWKEWISPDIVPDRSQKTNRPSMGQDLSTKDYSEGINDDGTF